MRIAVVTSGDNWPDSLAVPALVTRLVEQGHDAHGPFLTFQQRLTSFTLDRLVDLQPDLVLIVGGTAAVPAAVAAQLTQAGYEVTRLSGTDREETAVLCDLWAPEVEPEPEPEPGTGVQATHADMLADSIGVNTHMNYDGTPYVSKADAIIQLLKDAGIRHVRDGCTAAFPSQAAYDKMRTAGIKGMLIVDPRYWGFNGNPGGTYNPTPQQMVSARDFVKARGAFVERMETINEFDGSGRPTWLADLQKFTADMVNLFNADASTAPIPWVGPSLIGGTPNATFPDCDYGNVHPYTDWSNGPTPPTVQHLVGEVQSRGKMTPGKPVIASESGYPTGTSKRACSPTLQAKYVLRQYLVSFLTFLQTGSCRWNYLYEFADEGTNAADFERVFGIVDFNAQPKPAYTALKNLIALVADAGAAFTPGKLNYSLTFTGGQQFLLGKRDGSFVIVAWLDGSSTDADRSVPAQLVLPQGKVATWYRPTKGLTAAVPGQVFDDLTLIRVT